MIRGRLVTLRPAHEGDRRSVYEWLAESEVTRSMMGPPHFPENPVPTWEEFCADYVPAYFDGTRQHVERSYIIEVDGEAVGHVSYSDVDRTHGLAELDIWLRSEAVCGRGYGSDALIALTGHLQETLGLTEYILRPSRRNERAIASYARAGFVLLPLSNDEQAARYGPGDYPDTVVLCKSMAPKPGDAAQTS